MFGVRGSLGVDAPGGSRLPGWQADESLARTGAPGSRWGVAARPVKRAHGLPTRYPGRYPGPPEAAFTAQIGGISP
jgi:hypothetical protein